MKIYTSMPAGLVPYFQESLEIYRIEFEAGNLGKAWNHLENAHIIGQRYPYTHTCVHLEMLLFGIKIKSYREIIGQIPRLVLGGVKSFVGKVPLGNPGGADVPPLKPFPIKKGIQEIFEKAGIKQ
ncbi:DUF3703 domain-containing protein [Cyclobacterium sp. 1_MG-2023]|uniref:DUF3703 domain-containing protein n=1 Tax=Cyclobacterium sp. 1_MG-2023 TaxID=3062681 RepID=UPI0026E39C99|nr:DUF3703 domain-containing protein [Cyclobacterium sp. 1_MG-2023]MDO6436798.1 DUF3703 domain-containing protein [Cyclobacterium sp. 1_MG-2023]